MLKRSSEATANHIAQHVKDHHIGVFEKMVLLQQLHGLAGDIAAAPGSGRWSSAFHALHTVVSGEHEVLGAELFAVKVHLLENVNHRWHHFVGEGECAVVLRVTANLEHAFA